MKRALGGFFLILAAVLFQFLLAPLARASEVREITFSSDDAGTRVVIELSGPVVFSSNRLKDPERFYIDLKETALGQVKKEYEAYGPVKKIRIAPFDWKTLRVVFDLAQECKIQVSREEGKIVVLFERTTPPDGAVTVSHIAKAKLRASNPPARPKWRVVLDAGHGGHDPGAIGKNGLMEKNMTLKIALELARKLRKNPDFEVHLTRDKDVYLTLEERTLIANRYSADLFLSVHVNASPRPAARGIETYFLNFTDDEEANRVAARENQITLKRMNEARNELGFILASLELQEKRDDSLKLAHQVQNSLVTSIVPSWPDVPDLGVKQALFYVLVGAKMPSVLVEVSFISNEKDEKLLQEPGYIGEVSKGIAEGIENYLKDIPAQHVAKR